VNHSVNDSRREACPVHWGNGREWKGMEGKRNGALHHPSSYVTRGAFAAIVQPQHLKAVNG
jgi:hypothetical protein